MKTQNLVNKVKLSLQQHLELLFFNTLKGEQAWGFKTLPFFKTASPSLSNLLAVSRAWAMRAVYCSHQPLFCII